VRSAALVAVALMLAMIAIAIAGCSGQARAVVAPPVSTSNLVTATVPTTSPAAPLTSTTSRSTPSASTTRVAQAPALPAPAAVLLPVTHLARSSPVRLQITAIGVDSALMSLGLRADGSLQVPPGGFPAGWYTGGPTPGERGPAVIAGHIDWNGPGVFYRLQEVKPGDRVMVTRADGSKPVFRVTQVARYLKDQFPTKLVYGNIGHAGLRLITCGGTFNTQTGHYEENLVVYADLVGAAS
jgi:hypothetical protein